jgi:uncharacterized membrane protein YgcG
VLCGNLDNRAHLAARADLVRPVVALLAAFLGILARVPRLRYSVRQWVKMPFALLIVGLLLVVSAVRNTYGQLFQLVSNEFSGPGNFIYWIVAILIIGAVGYVQKLKPLSDGFLVLVILVLVLKRGNPSGIGGGFFNQFTAALKSTNTPATSTIAGSGGVSVSGGGSGVGIGIGPGGVSVGGAGGSVTIGAPGSSLPGVLF